MSRSAIAIVCMAVFAASCTSGDDEPQAAGLSPATPSTTATTMPREPVPLECEIEGYPCSLAEVPPEIIERSDVLGDEALAMFDADASMDDVDAWLWEQPDMVEVESDDDALRFRVEGGRGTWIYRAGIFGSRGSFTMPDLADSPPDTAATWAVESVPSVAAPFLRVVGDENSDEKSALVLSPFRWQFGVSDEGREVRDILAATRGYEGRVTFASNAEKLSANVGVDSFKGWGQFDVVHVATHGTRICAKNGEPPCRASVSAGMLIGQAPNEPGVTTLRTEIAKLKDRGLELAKGEGFARGLELVLADIVLLTADFFTDQYAGGLGNTFVFMNACESLGDEATDIADSLRGSTSVFMGWTERVDSSAARSAALQLYQDMSDQGYTIEVAYDRLGALRIDPGGSFLQLAKRNAGGDLRIRDVVHLLQPGTDAVLMSGNRVVIEGEKADGQDDVFPYVVQVDGVLEEHAGDVTVHVAVDGVETNPVKLSTGTVNDADQWTIDGMFELEFDLEEDQTSSFRAWVELHSTGESDHETPADIVGPDTCIVGTWAVHGPDVANVHHFNIGPGVAESVFAEGSLIATFRRDGTVSYDFSGWSVGITTFTESSIPGVIKDLHGVSSHTSNGSAHGKWKIVGFEQLELLVGDFDTRVEMRNAMFELEVDSRVDVLPDFARLYVIPNGTTRYRCIGNVLAIAWTGDEGVRWFRIGDQSPKAPKGSHKG